MAITDKERLKHGNFLPADGFRITVDKFPSIGPLAQGVFLPGLMLGEAIAPTPFIENRLAGDKLTFERLNVTVGLDENLEVYREVQQWIRGMAFPEGFPQYGQTQLQDRIKDVLNPIYSDISVIVLNSKSNANLKYTFIDAFPTLITGIQLDTTNGDNPHLTADITFSFTDYKLELFNRPNTISTTV